eukprot:2376380-Rhodomonas_salina.1
MIPLSALSTPSRLPCSDLHTPPSHSVHSARLTPSLRRQPDRAARERGGFETGGASCRRGIPGPTNARFPPSRCCCAR